MSIEILSAIMPDGSQVWRVYVNGIAGNLLYTKDELDAFINKTTEQTIRKVTA